MGTIFGCNLIDCYYNDNVQNRCLINEVTLDFSGTCENISICDEYECNSCEKYSLCLKEKKVETEIDESQFIDEEEVIDGGIITLILYCDNVNCDFNVDNKCTNEEGIYLDENGTCTSAKYLDNEGIIPSDEEEDWIKSM